MRNPLILPFLLIAFGWPGSVHAGEYKIENVLSSVLFKTRHMQTANAWGRFNDFSGNLAFDASRPEQSKLSLTVKAASVDTNSAQRDEHLRGADFFDAKQFPEIVFTSSGFEKMEGNRYKVKGKLTMMGVTKDVEATCEYFGVGKSPRGDKAIVGAEAVLVIKRSEFGMAFGIPNVGDEVTLTISVEAIEV